MSALVLVRHAESQWNARGLLTGWGDPPLTRRGRAQAAAAGRHLAAGGAGFDVVHTSALSRAQESAALICAATGGTDLTIHSDWRLNERHLGALEGLSKAEVSQLFGNPARRRWRDDPRALPPPLDPGDPRHPRRDPRYACLADRQLPNGEDADAAGRRALAAWHDAIVADLRAGRRVLVVAHQGPLGALAGHLGSRGGTRMANAEVLIVDLALAPACCGLPG